MTHREWAESFVGTLKDLLQERLISAVIFGSVATGRERKDSDIDLLLIIKEPGKGRFLRQKILEPAFEKWPGTNDLKAPRISPVVKSPEEAQKLSTLYFDMVDRRLVIFDRDRFFEKIMVDVKKRLDRLGAVRKKMGRIEFWDLKPDYKPGEIFEI